MLTSCQRKGCCLMKKLLSLCLALSLLCGLTGALADQTYTAASTFTLTYPDELTLDDTTYSSESTEDSKWLFLLEGGGYDLDATIELASGYEGFSLFSATDDEKDAYVDEVLDSFSESNPTYLSTVVSASGSVPFYIFSMEDADGPFYYAETIADGKSINFYCYYSDNATPDEALMDKLTAILTTFTPVA